MTPKTKLFSADLWPSGVSCVVPRFSPSLVPCPNPIHGTHSESADFSANDAIIILINECKLSKTTEDISDNLSDQGVKFSDVVQSPDNEDWNCMSPFSAKTTRQYQRTILNSKNWPMGIQLRHLSPRVPQLADNPPST